MFDGILPFAAILGGAGFGELIRKYIYIGRRSSSDRREVSRGRPRVQVTGPKVQPAICQICLGRIKEGTEYVKCSSGRVFHSVCLARVGHCPYCQRTVAIKGRETTTSKEYNNPMLPMPQAQADTAVGTIASERPMVSCPICGSLVYDDATACSCGAIFVPEGGAFACPRCGDQVTEGSASCTRCGERFDQFHPVTCPVCGREIPANAEACECGAILANRCPECGAELSEDDPACPTCGATFEFV